ncbi:hypothetical protein CC80DRAFT_495764 [Byssothecium circinans]|uniref:Uncharacterized protein n=1 Tax=Byssothecium circinans TaxID=147558 RepID=A0A6A5TH06_9PLEO|nr:hypothetical protein CC80DRAFT_495764 [Byssothecium circinans]
MEYSPEKYGKVGPQVALTMPGLTSLITGTKDLGPFIISHNHYYPPHKTYTPGRCGEYENTYLDCTNPSVRN